MRKILKLVLLPCLFLGLLIWLSTAAASPALALGGSAGAPACNTGADNLDLVNCYKLNDTQTVGSIFSKPSTIVNLLVKNLFIIGGIFFLAYGILGGWKFIEGGAKGKDEGLEIFKTALLGMLVMFAAYWVVQIIKILTGADIIL